MYNSLLPCPFCGKVPDLDDPDTIHPSGIFWRDDVENGYRHYVRMKQRLPTDGIVWSLNCPESSGGCGIEMTGDDRDEVLDKWNTRSGYTY